MLKFSVGCDGQKVLVCGGRTRMIELVDLFIGDEATLGVHTRGGASLVVGLREEGTL